MNPARFAIPISTSLFLLCAACGGGDAEDDNPLAGTFLLERCDNGTDDTNDGLTDCEDPRCQLESTCAFSPPDPMALSSALNATSLNDFGAANAFLYQGDNPVVRGVAQAAIDPNRAAVLRGRVLDAQGSPVANARVHIAGRPEYGYTYSRQDGAYELVSNGDEQVVVRAGGGEWLRVDRVLRPAPRDFTAVPPIALLPQDENANAISSARFVASCHRFFRFRRRRRPPSVDILPAGQHRGSRTARRDRFRYHHSCLYLAGR